MSQSDWKMLDLDPTSEIIDGVVKRDPSRVSPTYRSSLVRFYEVFSIIVNCRLCEHGHRKYGITVDKIPVVFANHESGKDPLYVPFRGLSPIRIPTTHDPVIDGVKWLANESHFLCSVPVKGLLSKLPMSIMDCIFADLKIRTIMGFCLNCRLMHLSGVGYLLEMFLKTILSHLIIYSRCTPFGCFAPFTYNGKEIELKIKRVWWGDHKTSFFLSSSFIDGVLKEQIFYKIYEQNLSAPRALNNPLNVNVSLFRFLDKICQYDAMVQCKCFRGARYCKKLFSLIFSREVNPKKELPNNTPYLREILHADYIQSTNDYDDPMLFWSLNGIGPLDDSALSRTIPLKYKKCENCNSNFKIKSIVVPETSWLFFVDFPLDMQKEPVSWILPYRNFRLGEIWIELAYLILLDTKDNSFTSLNLLNDKWYYFDDRLAGLLRHTNPANTKYTRRLNLRAVYYRSTESIKYKRCLSAAVQSDKRCSSDAFYNLKY